MSEDQPTTPQVEQVVAAAVKRAVKRSRRQQWMDAADDARDAYDQLEAAFSILKDLQDEYQGWLDNLPVGGSEATREKLEAVTSLDFDLSTVEQTVDEAEDIELPMGFGKD